MKNIFFTLLLLIYTLRLYAQNADTLGLDLRLVLKQQEITQDDMIDIARRVTENMKRRKSLPDSLLLIALKLSNTYHNQLLLSFENINPILDELDNAIFSVGIDSIATQLNAKQVGKGYCINGHDFCFWGVMRYKWTTYKVIDTFDPKKE